MLHVILDRRTLYVPKSVVVAAILMNALLGVNARVIGCCLIAVSSTDLIRRVQ